MEEIERIMVAVDPGSALNDQMDAQAAEHLEFMVAIVRDAWSQHPESARATIVAAVAKAWTDDENDLPRVALASLLAMACAKEVEFERSVSHAHTDIELLVISMVRMATDWRHSYHQPSTEPLVMSRPAWVPVEMWPEAVAKANERGAFIEDADAP